MLRKIIISSIIITILVCLALYYWKSCQTKYDNYDNYDNYNNYDPPLTPKSIKKKKVRFIETEDFIYYDPDEPPRDLKK